MNTKVNTADEVEREFKRAYTQLPVKYKLLIREIIKERCEWSQDVFYAKLNGRTRLRKPEIWVLQAIFDSHGQKATLLKDETMETVIS